MGIDNNVSVTGNVTRDPELRFTQGGICLLYTSDAADEE